MIALQRTSGLHSTFLVNYFFTCHSKLDMIFNTLLIVERIIGVFKDKAQGQCQQGVKGFFRGAVLGFHGLLNITNLESK